MGVAQGQDPHAHASVTGEARDMHAETGLIQKPKNGGGACNIPRPTPIIPSI